MNDSLEQQDASQHGNGPKPKVKLVAKMPGDDELPERNEEMKKTDGYEGSCGM
ncbi:hypothetical protein [Cohnella sp. CFH 77786]|uniref:hypothetical protein n=1 Tax=Cohnella sp. CFH 77786 TaxID=2662265 RepID=UPI001C60FC7C|nr:hypothetical protein [Cohnella sp. CFH 77786]